MSQNGSWSQLPWVEVWTKSGFSQKGRRLKRDPPTIYVMWRHRLALDNLIDNFCQENRTRPFWQHVTRTWTLSRGFIIGLEDMTPNSFDFNQVILKLICFKTVRNSWRLNAEYSRNNNLRMGSKFVDIRCTFTDIRWKTCLRPDSLHKRCYIGLGCGVVCLQNGRVWNCGCWHKDGRISWEERRHRPVVPKTLGIVRTVLVHITLAHLLASCTEVEQGGLGVKHVCVVRLLISVLFVKANA